MSRDYDPVPGQWYEDLDSAEAFQVVSLDPDEETVRLQWLEGEVEEIDLDAWSEMDVELTNEPEGWADQTAEKELDKEEDEEEEEEEEDDEDDWDDDDDDWDEDEDDEFRDRE